jgi:NCS1 family nucleobase:cation symporter-1
MLGVIVLFSIIYLLTVVIPTREGIDTWIYQRAVFGYKGIVIIWFVAIFATWGWEAVLTGIHGTSISGLYTIATGNVLPDSVIPWLGSTCVIVGFIIALMGPNIITKISYVVIPGVVIACIVLFYYVFSNYSWSELMQLEAIYPISENFRENYMVATEWNLAFVCAWYTVLGVIPRLGKSEKGSYWGFMVGYGVVYALIACVGAVGALAVSDQKGVYSNDPSIWFSEIGGGLAILSMVCLICSNISIMSVAMYSLSVSTKSVLPKWSYRKILIAWSIWVLFLNFSGVVMEYYSVFLAVIGFIGGPTVIIILVDYFLVRRQKISMRDMFEQGKENAYHYTKGFNMVGVVAFLCGTVAYFLVYDPINYMARAEIFNFTTGTGLSCIVAGLVYGILAQIPSVKNYLLKDKFLKDKLLNDKIKNQED